MTTETKTKIPDIIWSVSWDDHKGFCDIQYLRADRVTELLKQARDDVFLAYDFIFQEAPAALGFGVANKLKETITAIDQFLEETK